MGNADNQRNHRTKAQHYVPQFYLRGFANDSKRLFCYDKASGRMYPTSPGDAAQERNFYEVFPDTTEEPVADNQVEKQLGKIEQDFAPVLANIIREADAGVIDVEKLELFSVFVAVQWMRTKTYRDAVYELMNTVSREHVGE